MAGWQDESMMGRHAGWTGGAGACAVCVQVGGGSALLLFVALLPVDSRWPD